MTLKPGCRTGAGAASMRDASAAPAPLFRVWSAISRSNRLIFEHLTATAPLRKTDTLEEVRRAEVRTEPVLKRSRWMWLKDKHRWTKTQIAQHHDLSRRRLKTARAFRVKEELRGIFAQAGGRAEAAALLSWPHF